MITTIIFDHGEVIMQGKKGVGELLKPYFNKEEQIGKKLEGEELQKLFRGEISENEYWKTMIQKNNWIIDIQVLKEVIRKNFYQIPGTRQVIEELKLNNYKLGILSIHAKEWVDYCEKVYDYQKLFDAISYSYEEGLLKPDSRSYKSILNKLNSIPHETLFIDDHEVNISAAQNLGLHTIHFTSADQLKKDLKKLKININ